MKKDDVFDAILESEFVPELPLQAMGRTLPFVRANARASVEDIYRLSQAAENPAELILKAARSGADELAAAMRSLDGKPYRGFALLYAAQKAGPLVSEKPKAALHFAEVLYAEASSLPEVNRDSRLTTPAPRQAVQAEATILRSHALLQVGEADSALAAIDPAQSSSASLETSDSVRPSATTTRVRRPASRRTTALQRRGSNVRFRPLRSSGRTISLPVQRLLSAPSACSGVTTCALFPGLIARFRRSTQSAMRSRWR